MSEAGFRVDGFGRIDRSKPVTFTFNGEKLAGFAGDTVASAVLAAKGNVEIGSSVLLGRPRGIIAAGVEDPVALIQVETPYPEPMLLAPVVEIYEGMQARGLAGQGKLSEAEETARADAVHVHCDVLIVGAGPAGLVAAQEAAAAGKRVVIVDERNAPGGSLLEDDATLDGASGADWAAEAWTSLSEAPKVKALLRTTAIGVYDDGFVLAVERRTDYLGFEAPKEVSRERIWRIRADRIVIASGSHERHLALANNDLPGVMLAGSAKAYLHRFGVAPGRKAVVVTTNDTAYAVAADLADAGVEIVAFCDLRAKAPEKLAGLLSSKGITVEAGSAVTGVLGSDRVTGARIATFDGGKVGERREVECDLVLLSGGWNPAVHLYSHARGKLRYDETLGSFVPGEELENLTVCGAANGVRGLEATLEDGAVAGIWALGGSGDKGKLPTVDGDDLTVAAYSYENPQAIVWSVPNPDGDGLSFVDLQRDVTDRDVAIATGAGLRSVEHIKRYTTIGTAHDQGKTSGVLSSGIVAGLLGVDVSELGVTTMRPPYTQIAFGTLAGRNRGDLLEPIRLTSTHAWATEHGALFEDVGQWKRAWYFPLDGEDIHAAVKRECKTVREAVGMMDGSTLGKIDVRGPNAGEFLDRMYTNMMSTLKVGFVRYGVMCGLDGMVIDDGTVMRMGDEHFVLTTTTGSAAKTLEWMEEFLQTEWPELKVYLTSVTDHWATFPVAGPKSREVIGAVTDLDVSNEAFGFMTWQDAVIAGAPVRIARVSFSGELAFEVSTPWEYGDLVWRTLWEAGQKFGMAAYGTETMHVLRAEKGFPIIGQDTDGTISPIDLGMNWVVSKKKEDFIGKRSLARPSMSEPNRKHMVSLVPTDKTSWLPEGAQIVETAELPAPPVPMLGHVTSSYDSVALGTTFALALVKGGREKFGQILYVTPEDPSKPLIEVTVGDPVLFDKEGARRDG